MIKTDLGGFWVAMGSAAATSVWPSLRKASCISGSCSSGSCSSASVLCRERHSVVIAEELRLRVCVR